MCNCRTRIEKLLTEHHAAQNPGDKDHKACLTGYGVGITKDNSIVESMFMPVELQSTTTVKKTGVEKRVTAKTNMHFSHCPFCGEKRATA